MPFDFFGVYFDFLEQFETEMSFGVKLNTQNDK